MSTTAKFSSVRTIYCIGRNYAEHAAELGNQIPTEEPVVFFKGLGSLRELHSSSLAFPDETFHYEAELVLRIGSQCAWQSAPSWRDVDGIALGIDLTRRGVQSVLKAKGLPWTTAKSFAGSAILTPFLERQLWMHRSHFEFSLHVDGELKQQGNTKMMLFDVPRILKFLASLHELQPGDIVYTGTPAGVGPIQKGQSFTLSLKDPEHTWTGTL